MKSDKLKAAKAKFEQEQKKKKDSDNETKSNGLPDKDLRKFLGCGS